ncbi:ketopantoate reductase family protein [Pararobbsia silviterrae]|uniref:2-dehydropantoate 2-reductase n=1 Tax=Pararobbsia silviterrae TaxID=1792498 RepID=A0A494X995_9BURK|nr:2-dehydropantoate 2-reductase [Pararobbsia silviterrae]RKP46211.1 2-dehydropantoate 2-reductase [Pararobbsia silviterrae]
MKIAVMGAGAVGCYYGGMLARAGHEVVLIGRLEHVMAISNEGLRLQTQTFDERIGVAASTHASAAHGAELVLFCVKSTDTEAAACELEPHLSDTTLVLTLQNGVENAERLRTILRQPVAAAVVYVATEMAGPGHVRHHGRGELVIEPSEKSEAVAQMLTAAHVPTTISTNVRGELWAKLVLNCAYNALSAITQMPYGQLAHLPGVAASMNDVVAECLAVAQADGVVIPGDVNAAVRGIAETMPSQYSSTAQDLARGKHSEIDHLNGLVVRRGDALGVPVTANRLLHTIVKAIERKHERDARR